MPWRCERIQERIRPPDGRAHPGGWCAAIIASGSRRSSASSTGSKPGRDPPAGGRAWCRHVPGIGRRARRPDRGRLAADARASHARRALRQPVHSQGSRARPRRVALAERSAPASQASVKRIDMAETNLHVRSMHETNHLYQAREFERRRVGLPASDVQLCRSHVCGSSARPPEYPAHGRRGKALRLRQPQQWSGPETPVA